MKTERYDSDAGCMETIDDGRRLPDSLKIGAHEVKVVFPYPFKERDDLVGQYDKGLGVIRISEFDYCGNKRVESEIWVTFLHEILHAIDYATGHRMFCGGENEPKIEGLSEGLYQVLNDNGLLSKP